MHNFYYKTFDPNLRSFSKLLSNNVADLPPGGRFYFNLARSMRMSGENYLFRDGEWSDPFKTVVHPTFAMPSYTSNFNLNFSEVSDLRSLDIKKIINDTDRSIVIQWSGGIDSTVALVSLLKNLSHSELSNVIIAMSSDSLLENPNFYNKFIKDKFKIIDSENMLFNDYKEKYNAYCIMGDTGDCLFGSELGNKLYPKMKFIQDNTGHLYNKISSPDVHYSIYRDIIVQYFNDNLQTSVVSLKQQGVVNGSISEFISGDETFGELFYEKIVKNIETCSVPIYSLHDFFWWTIFGGRYIFCALRGPSVFSVGANKEALINDCLIQWFNTDEYQLWSMNNNNNGEKLSGPTQGLGKTAAKKYIYDFDKNEWYFTHKMKVVSSPNILRRNWRKHFADFDPMLGVDTNYNLIKIGPEPVNNYVIKRLMNYKIDWC
jgi:hypothetical protein